MFLLFVTIQEGIPLETIAVITKLEVEEIKRIEQGLTQS